MTDAKQNGRSGILALGGFVVVFHLLVVVLYVLAASPAFIFKYGLLTAGQLHLWTATISLPAVFLIAVLERRLRRRLLAFAVALSLNVWLVAVLYVFLFIPEGKVTLDPSMLPSEQITTQQP